MTRVCSLLSLVAEPCAETPTCVVEPCAETPAQTSSVLCTCLAVNTTPHTSHFLTELHAHAWLKSCVCRARIMCHPQVFVLHFPLSADHLLSYHLVLPPARQLHLPGCGGQIPCALSLMRTLAPLPSTTLSQVMSPTTATSWRLLNLTSRNPRSNDDATIGKALSSPLFTQEREDDACRRRAYHFQDEGLSSSLSSSVSQVGTGRPVVKPFDSQISSVREIPSHCSENEQIRILLERQREQFLADCQAEIRKHEFQADYD